ncbi:MAG: carbon-nitrogen hydrolase family protein [Planctomycetes bacterium]|nr:carbon-nitrogen hydrolase family protein [Planctomycetota bacterium]
MRCDAIAIVVVFLAMSVWAVPSVGGGASASQPAAEQPSGPGRLRVASCQFPVSSDVRANGEWIRKQVRTAHEQHADIVHFPEAALAGYGNVDHTSFDHFDWAVLRAETESILRLAAELKVWVVLGTMHRLTGEHKPHNCQYLINAEGRIVDRYDKRFCTTDDLKFYTPGDHFVTFEINGIRCGLLICYDVRFPELYREYRRRNVQVVFHSFYNARMTPDKILPQIMPVTAQAHAGMNYMFLSLTNSSAPLSWPCQFITPDGLVAARLPANEPGVLVNLIDTTRKYYDGSHDQRPLALDGHLSSGETPDDERSKDRRSY